MSATIGPEAAVEGLPDHLVAETLPKSFHVLLVGYRLRQVPKLVVQLGTFVKNSADPVAVAAQPARTRGPSPLRYFKTSPEIIAWR